MKHIKKYKQYNEGFLSILGIGILSVIGLRYLGKILKKKAHRKHDKYISNLSPEERLERGESVKDTTLTTIDYIIEEGRGQFTKVKETTTDLLIKLGDKDIINISINKNDLILDIEGAGISIPITQEEYDEIYNKTYWYH